MPTITKAWNKGTGSVSITYGGSGNGTIVVSSPDNDVYEDRSVTLTVKTSDNSISRTITVTLAANPAINISSATVTATAQTYSGSALTPVPTVTLNGTTVPSTGYDVTYSNNTNAGTATITITGKGNYTGTATGTFTINKATPTYTAPTKKTGLTYTGSAQALLNAGSTSHGTFYYSTNNSTWSTSIPTQTNANTSGYTVYWKLTGDSNHSDVASTTISGITIAKATGTISISSRSLTYTRNAQNLVTVSGNTGTVHYRLGTSGSWTTTIPTATNASTSYTIYYYVDTSTNYTAVYSSSSPGYVTSSIAKVTPVVATAPSIKTGLSYTGSAQDLLSGGSMKFSSSDSTAVAGTFTYPQGTNAGTYSTLNWSFTPTDTTNYNSTSGTVTGSALIAENYSNHCLTIVSEADNNAIGWKTGYDASARTIQISTDEGQTWTSVAATTSGVTLVTLNNGDTLLVKGSNNEYFDTGGSWNSPRANMFTSSGNFHVEGNIMSLIYGDNYKNLTVLPSANSFRYMFYNCSKLTTAENLIMPATTLTESCYDRMFSNCTILTATPMLPAETLVTGCYSYMFNGSRAVNYIRCLAIDHSASNCTNNWVQNVASSGTFIKHKNATWSRGNSAVPTNWVLDDYGCGIAWSASTFTTYMNNTSNVPVFTNSNNLSITFTSSDTSVATVSSNGVVTVVGLGTTTLTASFAGNEEYDAETVTCVYTVSKVAAGISWSVSTLNADPESSTKPVFSNPNNLNVTITSSDTSVATVSSSGVVTYLTEGTTTLTASYAGDSIYNSSTVTCVLTLAIDYSTHYLTIVSLEDGNSIYLNYNTQDPSNGIKISVDSGLTWSDTIKAANITSGGRLLATLNTGDKLLIKGNNDHFANLSNDRYVFFGSSKTFDIEGNILSLVYEDNFIGKTTITATGSNSYGWQYSAFAYLFKGSKAVSAKNLVLPIESVPQHCYYGMFCECEVLTTAPALPATTLATGCYSTMFYGCASLITAPALPATILADRCYSTMFQGCTSLTTVPELPATTLTSMCYSSMFKGCTSLTTAPELPATTLVYRCYSGMFQQCNKLNYIKALFTTTPGSDNTSYWVNGVASSGTFVKNSAATWSVTGANGIPSGWTVQTASS